MGKGGGCPGCGAYVDQGLSQEQGHACPHLLTTLSPQISLFWTAVQGQAGWGGALPLTPWCPALQMEAIGKLSDDMRRHFRMKLRNLFTKFIRKFGSVH